MAKKEKCTRLFYNDEKHLKIYEALPPEQFKELIMAMLKYQYGDEEFVNAIQDPVVKALFIGEKVDIDRNEEEWIRRKETYKQNGSKGGRPPKEVLEQEEPETNDSINQDNKEIQKSNISLSQEEIRATIEEKPAQPIDYKVSFEDAVTAIKDSPQWVKERMANKYRDQCGYSVKELIDAARS